MQGDNTFIKRHMIKCRTLLWCVSGGDGASEGGEGLPTPGRPAACAAHVL